MKKLELVKVEHTVKIGDFCGDKEPNVTEDCVFYEDGKPVGFFMRDIKAKLKTYVKNFIINYIWQIISNWL